MRIIFAGTPEFAATHLQGILHQGEHQIIAVYSQPDRPAGRGKQLKPSPVKQLALDHNINVYQPASLKTPEAQHELEQLEADLMVVVAYGLLLPLPVLQAPRYGCINVHASLLPRWRGAAPIQRAIEAGDEETGVIIMQMDEGLDTGDMLLEARCKIGPQDTAGGLHDTLAKLGVPALNETLNMIANGQCQPTVQDHGLSNYASKISKEEAQIDWQQPAAVIERKIRAFNPFPTAYTCLGGDRIKIWRAQIAQHPTSAQAGTIASADKNGMVVACGEGALQLQTIQLPGGKPLDISAVLNSKAERFSPGTCFDD